MNNVDDNRMDPWIAAGIFRHAITSSPASLDAFWKWYRPSKVTHPESGRPILAFHGTADNFAIFDHAHGGKATGASDSENVFWFSREPRRANLAAMDAAVVKNDRNEAKYEEGANVMPVFLRVARPKIYKGWIPDPEKCAKQLSAARAAGYDAIIWKLGERIGMTGSSSGEIYAVFDSTQIKSAIGNPGTFDPSNPHITDGHEPLHGCSLQ